MLGCPCLPPAARRPNAEEEAALREALLQVRARCWQDCAEGQLLAGTVFCIFMPALPNAAADEIEHVLMPCEHVRCCCLILPLMLSQDGDLEAGSSSHDAGRKVRKHRWLCSSLRTSAALGRPLLSARFNAPWHADLRL